MSRTGRVVVFGSLHYDIAVETDAWPRLGETAVGADWRPKLGGKGRNQAIAAARAGAATEMIGVVGDDQFGRELVDDLAAQGVAHERVRRAATSGTGISVALFEPSGDYRAVIVSGANLELGTEDVPPPDFWEDVAVLLIQNEVREAANGTIAQAAHAANVSVVLNAAPARPPTATLNSSVDLVVVNAIEAAALTGEAEPRDLSQARRIAQVLLRNARAVVVTAGESGLAYADRDRAFALPAERVAVVNTHGAGDAFVGTLAAVLASGAGMEAALTAANHAAAVLVSSLGEG